MAINPEMTSQEVILAIGSQFSGDSGRIVSLAHEKFDNTRSGIYANLLKWFGEVTDVDDSGRLLLKDSCDHKEFLKLLDSVVSYLWDGCYMYFAISSEEMQALYALFMNYSDTVNKKARLMAAVDKRQRNIDRNTHYNPDPDSYDMDW